MGWRCRARWVLMCLLAGAAVPAPAQPASPAAAEAWPVGSPVTLPAAQQFDLQAGTAGPRYRIFLSQPEAPPPAAGYPVLYVLDGNAAFPVAAFLARGFASRREVTGHPQVLVVGIGYPGEADFDVPARLRDYTFSASRPEAVATQGGADRLLDVIEQQIKPLVATQYPIDLSRQALFGHSLGGLFVLHTLFTRPASFSTYLASSPSIWWDGHRVMAALPRLADMPAGLRPRVQISVGALEDAPPQGQVPADMLALLASRTMVAPARLAAERLRALPGWHDRVIYHELADEDHGPVWLPAMSRGFRWFLAQP